MTQTISSSVTSIPSGLSELAGRYDVILCDIWGVVHDGRRHFPAAAEALMRWRAGGGKVILITNAPRPYQPIQAQLDLLGVSRDAYDGMVTSGDVTVDLIAGHGGQRVWHIGPERDLTLFDEVHAATGVRPELSGAQQADYVVCTGLYDDAIETPADYAGRLDQIQARELPMICANPDIVVHVGAKLIYCAGALAQAYQQIGGAVAYAGKPHAPIYARALELAGARPGGRVLAIGDAMATDMKGANRQGIDALFITHGIHRHALHPTGDKSLTADRLSAFLAGEDFAPKLAMSELVW